MVEIKKARKMKQRKKEVRNKERKQEGKVKIKYRMES